MVLSMAVAVAQEGQKGGGAGAGKGPHGARGGGGMDGMLAQLKLDEKQQAEVAKIKEEMKSEFDKAKGNREAMRPVMQQYITKIQAVLTPEQKTKFEELHAQRMKGRGPGGPGGAGGGEGKPKGGEQK
jgi:Spy/CpxP family protein refolding chaperone